ncbi:hypothetical protein C8Q72DRAFT_798736 [Fomitopsis betulina]|nr:hypothetical protein C8Q72DRAFT_798736 [Fomitopsis betulina]
MLQEHNSLWTKTVYSAQGSGASWEWLKMVSPCVNVLRRLVSGMNDAIGSKQGTKHAAPDIARDLRELRHSLAEAQLAAPLAEYNNMFSLLKKRRQRTSPLVGHSTATTSTLTPAAETGPTVSESQSSAHVAPEPGDQTSVAQGSRADVQVAEVVDDDDEETEEADSEGSLTDWLQPDMLFSLDEDDNIECYFD